MDQTSKAWDREYEGGSSGCPEFNQCDGICPAITSQSLDVVVMLNSHHCLITKDRKRVLRKGSPAPGWKRNTEPRHPGLYCVKQRRILLCHHGF